MDVPGHTFPPVLGEDAARIVIEIHNSGPLDLPDFTASLTGLAREHEPTFRCLRPDLGAEESRLLVMDVRKGSIVIELAATLAPLVAPIELTNTAVSFVRNMKAAIGMLALPGGRPSPEEATTQRLKNFGDAVAAVANDTAGHLIVDLEVETVGGRPKVYRVLEVHEVIDLEEEG
ncbi:hypothetical protein ACIKTA_02120 [Hansschlegelia beijingensis]